MMIFSLVAMIGLDKCCITSACLQWLCHSGERIVARGPLVTVKNWLIVLAFNHTSTLVGHFVSSPREREKIDRRGSRGDKREGQGRRRKMNESEEAEVKIFPSTLTCCNGSRPCPTVVSIS